MKSPKQLLKDWLGITRLETKVFPLLTARTVDNILKSDVLEQRVDLIKEYHEESRDKLLKGYEPKL